MKIPLFDEFDPVSSKLWKQKIQFELDGADYNETMIWNSPEDIKVKPFYHQDSLLNKYTVNSPENEFSICQNIFVYDVSKSIERALDSLKRGATSLRFTIENESIAIIELLDSLPLDGLTIYFNFGFLSSLIIEKIEIYTQDKDVSIYYNLDPIGKLAGDGNWFSTSEKTNFDSLIAVSKKLTKSSYISVDMSLYQNAGANMVQQLTYGLAHVNEYFNRIPSINSKIVFEIAVGTNYFFEIAKLRAFRILFQTLSREYDHNQDCHLLVTPTKRNKTIYGYHINMLRTTTECMSAIVGGADSISNLSYDSIYHKDNEFGDRIARNQLLILKEESHFGKVKNPADGSYYIESLTQQLADKALVLFKEIELKGGFLKLLNEGVIQSKIQLSADKEQHLFDTKAEPLIGTNKHASREDLMKGELELFPFVKMNPRKTLIVPIIEKRLSDQLDQDRLATE
ncbi:methylmalonyl-CoA mutase subunit beta [Flavobacterium algicola]|uniref:methylmalonyl-CoA mutase subunit beta n=1 Tax=Flavobacterium algicola TaxID=556529 RepID=UPI001EFDE464|nr:methylmalonyl-CoA mutase subunit beta [Flavobacterium algicola]MCG9791196.1 methylmalonyl-CoA mutase subunit beta [Flavobacterium algicola]